LQRNSGKFTTGVDTDYEIIRRHNCGRKIFSSCRVPFSPAFTKRLILEEYSTAQLLLLLLPVHAKRCRQQQVQTLSYSNVTSLLLLVLCLLLHKACCASKYVCMYVCMSVCMLCAARFAQRRKNTRHLLKKTHQNLSSPKPVKT
jgi:FlaA1/EpsC-like NDP-sugar epimerase